MRPAIFLVRSTLFPIEDVIGADRHENGAAIAGTLCRGADCLRVDREGALRFVLAAVDVVKCRGVHEYVGPKGVDRTAHACGVGKIELRPRRCDDRAIAPGLPDRRPELSGTSDQKDALHTVDRRPVVLRWAMSESATAI